MIAEAPWIAWVIVIPLCGAALSMLFGRRGPLVIAVASLGTLGSVAGIVWQVWSRGAIRHAVGGWRAPLGIALRADGLSALMLSTFGVVGTLVVAHASGHYRGGPRGRRFLSLWLIAWAALNALVLSADVFNLYVTLELLTLVAVALIVLERTREALAAALEYLLLAVTGSLFYLAGVALLYARTATLDIELVGARLAPEALSWAALAVMTVGLCLKAGLFPLHAWLPPAYVSASPPVSALLSALISKAPYVVVLRLWLEVFPSIARPAAAQVLGVLGGSAVLWGSLLALRQRRLKRLLAYSSLAQVGYLFLFFPLASPRAYAGAVYFAVSYAAASASMFTAAGTIERSVGHDDLDALKGVAQHRPLTFFALALAGTSVMGLPPSGGFIAKWFLVRAALERGQWWWAVVVLVGGLLAAGYVFPVLRGAFLPLPRETRLCPVPLRAELVSLTLAIIAIALGIAPTRPLALLDVGGRP